MCSFSFARDCSNRQIAGQLGIAEATVKAHVSKILNKLGVYSRTQAVIAVHQNRTGRHSESRIGVGWTYRLSLQRRRMMANVIGNERCDEKVAVVIARLHPQFQRMLMLAAHSLQPFGHELLFKKIVGTALVYQDRQPFLRAGNKAAGVMGVPGLLVLAEINRREPSVPRDNRSGATIGAKAETDRYLPGFFSATVRAPCPPIEWPDTLIRSRSTGNALPIT